MSTCECGCGQASARDFLPGHDQKLRTSLEAEVGGLLALRTLVSGAKAYAEGATTEVEFNRLVRQILSHQRQVASAA
jgi:hypothetical protein